MILARYVTAIDPDGRRSAHVADQVDRLGRRGRLPAPVGQTASPFCRRPRRGAAPPAYGYRHTTKGFLLITVEGSLDVEKSRQCRHLEMFALSHADSVRRGQDGSGESPSSKLHILFPANESGVATTIETACTTIAGSPVSDRSS